MHGRSVSRAFRHYDAEDFFKASDEDIAEVIEIFQENTKADSHAMIQELINSYTAEARANH